MAAETKMSIEREDNEVDYITLVSKANIRERKDKNIRGQFQEFNIRIIEVPKRKTKNKSKETK